MVMRMHPLRSAPALLPQYASLVSLLIPPPTSTSTQREPTLLSLLPCLKLELYTLREAESSLRGLLKQAADSFFRCAALTPGP